MARRKFKELFFENISIERAGAKGVSIAKAPDGKTILVHGAVPGDVSDVKIYKKKNSYYEGNAVEIREKSPFRVDPLCIHFGVCGGCKWQNLSYEAQLQFKQDEVENNLKRIGGFHDVEILPIIGSEKQYYYRNKLEFSFSNSRWLTPEEIHHKTQKFDRDALGFHIPGQWSKVLDLRECHLQSEPSNSIRLEAKNFAKANQYSFFDLQGKSGLLRSLMIRSNLQGDFMVMVQFFYEDERLIQEYLTHLKLKFPSISSLMYAVNPKDNDSIYDLDVRLFFGEDFLIEEMEGLTFKIGPKSFYQTNPLQAKELYKVTRDFANLTGDEIVYDLYTGTGTIAQFISKKAKKVVGIESVAEAIQAAKENAVRNGIKNCTFFCGDMKDIFDEKFIEENVHPDVLITDPPRDGMHPKVVDEILRIKPPKIVYVSCNSATQARDLQLMKEIYKIKKVQPVDMFPQTHHVENVVLLERI